MTTILPFTAQDPPMPRAWACLCGKSSVLGRCWNCGRPRPMGDGEDEDEDEGGAVDGEAGRLGVDNGHRIGYNLA